MLKYLCEYIRLSLIVAVTVMDFIIASGFGFEKVQEVKLLAKLASHEEIPPTCIKVCAAFDF